MLSLSEASSSLFVFFIVVCVKNNCQNAIFVFGHQLVKRNYYLKQEAFIGKLAEHKWSLMKYTSTKITDLFQRASRHPWVRYTKTVTGKKSNKSIIESRQQDQQTAAKPVDWISRQQEHQQTGQVGRTCRQDQQMAGGPVGSVKLTHFPIKRLIGVLDGCRRLSGPDVKFKQEVVAEHL